MSTSKEEGSSSESNIGISKRFWTNCTDEVLYFRYSPLFVHMASGSLGAKEFNQYVANYAHLLKDLMEVYKLAADQCQDNSDKAAFLGWSSNVKQELERLNSFADQKLGFNPTIETAPRPATAKYKEFLLATASGNVQDNETPVQQSKILAYTLGAMMPSLRLYAFLSKEMHNLVSAYVNSHPYNKWFKEYSYKRFKASYRDAEELLDKLCNSLAQEEIQVVERLYRRAMRLEMDFFYSRQAEQTLILPICPMLDAKKERLMLVADFDFTCTSVASLEILANIEILSDQKLDQQLQGEDRDGHSKIASIDLRKTWEHLSQQYTLENDNFKKEIMLGKKADSFDSARLYSAFEKLSSPDGQALSRIFDSGVLKGISLEDIKQAGKCMKLHNGCLDFFEKVNKLDVSVNVMSCWSGDLTRSALSGGLDMLKVDGNEFSYADGIFTGEVTRQAHQSVTAKLKYFEDMVQVHASEHGVGARTVYIGDSVSDLLCLLTADIGIVVGSNKSLIEVGNHFGITFLPLYAGVVKEQRKRLDTDDPVVWRGAACGTVYTVTSWIEIQAFILGLDFLNEDESHRQMARWVTDTSLTTEELSTLGEYLENPEQEEDEKRRKRDYISELPDSMIYEIFSLLDTKYAVSMSVLSKKWRSILKTMPFLNFNFKEFKDFKTFVQHIKEAFKNRDASSNIKKLLIRWEEFDASKEVPGIVCLLNTWIRDALKYNVEDLSVLISENDQHSDKKTELCRALFTSTTLRSLELNLGENRGFKVILPKKVDLPQLRTLKFEDITIYDEDSSCRLFSNSPLLESLTLIDCCMDLYELSLDKLKDLQMIRNRNLSNKSETIMTSSSNLTAFTYESSSFSEFAIQDFSSQLVNADVRMVLEDEYDYVETDVDLVKRILNFLRAIQMVQNLKVSQGIIKVLSEAPSDLLRETHPQFSNVQRLEVSTFLTRPSFRGIAYVLNICPHVESLRITIMEEMDFEWQDIGEDWNISLGSPFILHDLRVITLVDIQREQNEIELLEILVQHAKVLKEVVLYQDDRAGGMRVRDFVNKLLDLKPLSRNVRYKVFGKSYN